MRHDERFWVRRARDGDTSAFGLLAARYLPKLRKWIGTRVSPEKVDDLSQETLLRAFESIENLADLERFPQWLRGISLNVVRMHYRSEATQSQTLDRLMQSPPRNKDHHAKDPIERHLMEELLSSQMADALRALKPGYRETLTLFYNHGRSYAQIAKTLGISEAAVKGRMHRGRKQLKARLTQMEEAVMVGKVNMVKARIHEVYRTEIAGKKPMAIVILKPNDEELYVPVWMAEEEGQTILMSLRGETAPRPLTHDLMANLLTAAGVKVERIAVNELEESVFYSQVRVRDRNGAVDIDARPSDAIALALRSDCDLVISRGVLEAGGTEEISPEVLSYGLESKAEITPLELPDFGEWMRLPGEDTK